VAKVIRILIMIFAIFVGLFVIISVYILFTDSKPEKHSVSISENISPAAKQLLATSLPNITRVCPGLDKYSKSLHQKEIIDDLNATYPEYRRVTISFTIPQDDTAIPNSYRAWGHTCSMDISADGKTLTIMKDPCKSVFTDTPIEDRTGSNLVINLQ